MAINANAREWLRRVAETGDVLGAIGAGEPWLRARLEAPQRATMATQITIRWYVPPSAMPVDFFDGVQWHRVPAIGQHRLAMPAADLTLRLRVGPRTPCNKVVRLIRTSAIIGIEPEVQCVPIGGQANFRVYATDSVETLFREEGNPWQLIPPEAEICLNEIICDRRAQVAARGTDGNLVIANFKAVPSGFPQPSSNEMQILRVRWEEAG